ncbi:MAG: hypothetical protein GY757_13345, partial [bacterium]|nr:hypothetical protein [bacterium]
MRENTLLDKLKSADSTYFGLLESIKQWCRDLWEDYNDVHEQLRHGTSHSEKMMGYADTFLRDPLEKSFFTPEELFLVTASILLHDIGMQTGWKEHLDIEGSRGELSKEERLKIRNNHAETSAAVIRSFKQSLPKTLDRNLNQVQKDILCHDLNEPLAFVCLCHNKKDIETYIQKETARLFPGSSLKIGLAAAILQFCDTMDMDKNRLNESRFRDALDKWDNNRDMEEDYSATDWMRFFRSHYVESVTLTPLQDSATTFQLIVEVRFNSGQEKAVVDRFLEVYWSRLQKSRHDCITVINNEANIHFLNDYPFKILEPNATKIKIPGKLLDTLKIQKQTNTSHQPTTLAKHIGGSRGSLPLALGEPAGRPLGEPPEAYPAMLGRQKDLAEIKKRLLAGDGAGRVVTIKGAPGIGKTTLARALMRDKEIEAAFTEGCYFVPLEGVYTQESLVLQIANRLGVPLQAGVGEKVLLEYLGGKKILLVLDNFEDVLRDRARTVGFMTGLNRACPAGAIVCTSRETMNAAAVEVIHRVGRLDRDSSRELLLTLADVGEGDEDPRVPEELLDELDDLPLAIILAAPYLVYGTAKILADIRARGAGALRIFGIEETDAQKDQSLERSFGLSYRTIAGTDAEKLFCAASLFPAGFRAADIAVLLPRVSFSCFITLESKSLLVRDKEVYSMLTPLRYYAGQIFDAYPGKADLLVLWFQLMITKAREYKDATRGKGDQTIAQLVARLPNIYLCLDYLLEFGKNHMESMFTILFDMSDFFRFRGISASALNYLSAAKAIAVEREDTVNEANCIQDLGDIHFIESRNDDAKRCFEEALPLYGKIGHVLGEANCIVCIALILIKENQLKKAKTRLEKALSLYEKINDTY